MSDVSRILDAAAQGDPQAANELLPLVYEELRNLAAARLRQEQPGQTLEATALVHEAYLRLIGHDLANASGSEAQFVNRRHFFAAAAEAMRRILIENARRKQSLKYGGGQRQVELREADLITTTTPDELLAVDEALAKLAVEDAPAAEIVKLRYYAGLSVEEAADVLGLSRAAAYRHWTYARAWLRCAVQGGENTSEKNAPM